MISFILLLSESTCVRIHILKQRCPISEERGLSLFKIMINIQVSLHKGNIFCLSQHTLSFLNFSHHIFDSIFSNFDSSLKVILTAE